MSVRVSPFLRPARSGSRRTVRIGGVGFVVAGVLQLLAVVRVVLPSVPEWVTPGWQLSGWLVGGLVLLAASILLAVGWRGEAGIVGSDRRRRAALIVSGTGSLLLVVVVVLALVIGSPVQASTTVALALAQLLILVATVLAAVSVLALRTLTGVARWALPALAAVEAVAALLSVVPDASLAFLDVVVVAGPVVAVLAGLALALHGRGRVGVSSA